MTCPNCEKKDAEISKLKSEVERRKSRSKEISHLNESLADLSTKYQDQKLANKRMSSELSEKSRLLEENRKRIDELEDISKSYNKLLVDLHGVSTVRNGVTIRGRLEMVEQERDTALKRLAESEARVERLREALVWSRAFHACCMRHCREESERYEARKKYDAATEALSSTAPADLSHDEERCAKCKEKKS